MLDAYVLHLRFAHREVNEAMQRVGSALSTPTLDDTTPPVVDELERLRNELSRHFAEEEMGGCLEEAVCRCPSLHQESRRVQSEHTGILSQADDLVTRARSNTAGLHTVMRRFERLAKRVRRHADAECHVVEQAFGQCVE